MELIERYLFAVKGHLPPAQQEDVIAELRENLQSRIDEREELLGRPITEAEVSGILRQLGRPMLLASRYSPRQALVGPALLPYYLQTLKVTAGIALAVQVVVAIVMLASGRAPGESLKPIYLFPFTTLPFAAGWITLVFAVLERSVTPGARIDTWDPSTLPPVRSESTARTRVGIVGDIIGLLVTLAWWLAVRSHPFLLLGPIAAFLVPGPGWHRAYVPVAVMIAVAIGGHAMAWARPAWRRPARIAGHLLALAGLALLWGSDGLLVPSGLTPPPGVAQGMEVVQRYAPAGIGLIAGITIVELVRDLWRLQQQRLRAGAPAGASTRPEPPR